MTAQSGGYPGIAVPEPWPGTFDVRCTLTYRVYPLPATTTVLSTTVTIAPPDGYRIVAGLKTPTPVGSGIAVVFQVTAGGQDCGPYLGGTAQEWIWNKWLYGVYIGNDTDWSPPVGQPDPAFQLQHGQIIDVKTTAATPDWFAWAGGTYYKSNQWLQIAFVDPCGKLRTYFLSPVFSQSRQKLGPYTWQISQQ